MNKHRVVLRRVSPLWVLRVAAWAIVYLVATAGPASGSNWGSSNCGTNPDTSYCIHNNDTHTYHFTSSVSTTMRSATNTAAEAGYEPTQLNISSTTSSSNTDVVIKMFNYGDSGYAGATLCPANSSKTGTNPRVVCRPQELRYNVHSSVAILFDTSVEREYVACHELGHTVGLRHSTQSDSCMQEYPGLYGLPSLHDKIYIDAAY